MISGWDGAGGSLGGGRRERVEEERERVRDRRSVREWNREV